MSSESSSPSTNDYTLIKASRIFDGTGAAPVSGQAILLNDGKIAAMGPVGDISAPDGSNLTIKDYGDSTILPGLVDGHTHMMAPGDGTHGDITGNEQDDVLLMRALQNARTFLHAGVTTARENGAKNKVGFSLKDGINMGLSEGPEMVISGRPITITGGHFWYCGSEADGVEGVRAEVRKLVKEGADFIKIMATGGSTWSSNALLPSYTIEEMTVIVDEAHRFGKLTAAHCASMQGIKNALDAGVDMIIHCVFEDETGMYKFNEPLAEQLAAAKAWVNPTLHVVQAGIDLTERIGYDRGWLTKEEQASIDSSKRSLETRVESVNKLVKMGVRMIAGSDSPWGAYPPGEFVKEMIALTQAGLTNTEALVTGLSHAAESIAVGDQAGTLAVNRPGDVLVVGGNPIADLNALWDVKDVFKAGSRVARPV
ncbi:MAG: amidohydrolase family protein [Chloroflexi bacterium]|nr:amidohydrolase family protein [Chloroflexota bacterium]MBT5627569.1 amidohydrolase family protein [Chloroflexota bacterium]